MITYVSHIESNFKATGKRIVKLWVQLENIKKVVPINLMKVAVGKSTNVAR